MGLFDDAPGQPGLLGFLGNESGPTPTLLGAMISRYFATTPSALEQIHAASEAQKAAPDIRGKIDAALQSPMASAFMPSTIRAYHGSPYSFDKFDLSKVGAGEGAQAYGHGLYFAENEGVAKAYRDNLSRVRGAGYAEAPSALQQQGLDILNQSGTARRWEVPAKEMLPQLVSNYEDTLATAPEHVIVGGKANLAQRIEALKSLDATKLAQPGSMYEVNIHADPASLLDWDKPLAQQPSAVRGLLDAAPADPTGRGAYSRIAGQLSVQRTPQGITVWNPNPADASRALLDAGVPGIKYLDGGSRAAGSGTSNYVMFDPQTIEMLRKYGLAGGLLGGSQASGLFGDNPQPQPGLLGQ